MVMRRIQLCAIPLLLLGLPNAAHAQDSSFAELVNDSVVVRFVNADLRLAIQTLARYLDRPVIFGEIGQHKVTLETPSPVPREEISGLVRGILQSYDLGLQEEGSHFRVARLEQRARQPAEQAAAAPPIQLFVIQLRHARAADVGATVKALYGQATALGERGRTRGTLADGLRDNLVQPFESPQPGQQAPVVPGVAELSGEVTIIPDSRTNSLLIRASRADFELIQAAVQELDVRPLQVLIEVIIAEVRRDRSLGFGVEASYPERHVSGTGNTTVAGATTGLGLGDFVLEVMGLGGVDMDVVLRATASQGDVSILSRPVLLTANNEAAEIVVGSQRPFVQVQRALPTDAPVRDQVVQFKDVGTRLTVIPTASEDGYVMLEVVQEVNAATAEVAFDAPVISTRSVQTQLLVRDGQTAVLGGLADRQRDFTRSGVPFLSSIPLIGGLFGSQVVRTTETELFLFLTPRVIRSDEELDEVSDDVGHRTKRLREKQGGL